MAKDTKSNSRGWLKGVLSNQSQPEQNNINMEEDVSQEMIEESSIDEEFKEFEQSETTSKKNLLSKDDQDKVALDLIVSLENMLHDRQLIQYKNKGLESQLYSANEMIGRLKHSQVKKEQILLDKDKEIRELESNLTNKQMSYDQLLEDFKDYQSSSKIEFGNITNQLEKETNKYNKLKEESTNKQYEQMMLIKDFEEKIRDLEVENHKVVEQYKQSQDEKAELMQTINDFTDRLSFSFSPKTTTSTTTE
ncbi:hypothetical protein [Bacillus sp. SM2101]|uniref:hypothetical protein n=1 Tax=Bacillus sp. SM2101 TaxID=2805366 RepID=UPI001BDDF23E|nr:hypothetical protein [Bacillus sp. SM2101]